MTNNVLLFKAANDAIFALYSDMSVDKATTIDRLGSLERSWTYS